MAHKVEWLKCLLAGDKDTNEAERLTLIRK